MHDQIFVVKQIKNIGSKCFACLFSAEMFMSESFLIISYYFRLVFDMEWESEARMQLQRWLADGCQKAPVLRSFVLLQPEASDETPTLYVPWRNKKHWSSRFNAASLHFQTQLEFLTFSLQTSCLTDQLFVPAGFPSSHRENFTTRKHQTNIWTPRLASLQIPELTPVSERHVTSQTCKSLACDHSRIILMWR